MPKARITFRHRRGEEPGLWANREGTRREIRESAENLLADLQEEGHRTPAVYVDGHRIQRRRGA